MIIDPCLWFIAKDAEVTITEKSVSVKKEQIHFVGDNEMRYIENSPTFVTPLLGRSEAFENENVVLVFNYKYILSSIYLKRWLYIEF